MDQARRLKLSAVGVFHPANIIILSVCGAVAGYFWYRAMRWSFGWMRLQRHDGIDTGANP